LTTKRWPLHPKPREYELLYRWIERLSEGYEISYKTFCKNVIELTPEEIGKLRTVLPEKALVTLSNGTGVPIEDLRQRELNTMFKIQLEELARLMKEHSEESEDIMTRIVHKQ
jgi:hypothetical protein